MAKSLTARLMQLVPPGQRLHDNIVELNRTVEGLVNSQEALTARVAGLSADTARLSAPAPSATPAEKDTAELDRFVARTLGETALRHLPFLPNDFQVGDEAITVWGFAGAADGITDRTAFFVNGNRIRNVDFPIPDPNWKARFPDVAGMGWAFKAVITENLEALRGARFWRFDVSPTGRYHHDRWRQAVHYMNPLHEAFPFPPAANIKRVIGDTSIERFAMGGAMIFHNLAAQLAEMGFGWSDFPNILDWGCGAGRLTRYLAAETGSRITGADIDADNIAWCRDAYPGASFELVPLRPPTGLADSAFDLVVGISVLTHLQEEDQFLWLAELRRITRSGALVFLSIQGPTQLAYNRFPPDIYRQIQQDGYLNLSRDGALDAVVEDKEYYRAAMHSRDYILRRWSAFFEVLSFEDAIAALQDFVVLRRR